MVKRVKLKTSTPNTISIGSGDPTTVAMLVRCRISTWGARNVDKQVSEEIAKQHNADKRSGRYVKKLFPQGALSYDTLVSACNSARGYHYANTLPWQDGGTRILPAANYLDYVEGIRGIQRKVEECMRDFLNDYPKLKKGAEKVLGDMFNDENYPTPEIVASKFGITTSVFPMPSSRDFRVTLGSKDSKDIKAQIDAEVSEALKDATEDLWQRLFKSVSLIADRLADPEARFKGALIGNAVELCEMLPRLNITNDVALNDMARQVKKSLEGWDPDDLRKDKAARKQVAGKTAKNVAAIESKMKGLF